MLKWFTVPDFNDEESNNRAYHVSLLLLVINLALFIDHTVLMFTHSQNYIRWISTFLIVFTASLFLFRLIKKGRSFLASYLFVTLTWIINFALVWTAGGIRAPETINFIFVIFITGYLLGNRAGLFMIILTSIAEFFLVFADNNGFLPVTAVRYDGYSLLFEYWIFLFIIAFIHFSFTKRIQVSLTKATKELEERKFAEAKLKAANNFLIKAQKAGRIGTFDADLINDEWRCSENLYNILGLEEGSIYNFNTWLNHIHPDDKAEIVQYFLNTVLVQKINFDRTYRIYNPAVNQPIWVWGIGEIECDSNGEPIRIFGLLQDISERKTAEREMTKLTEAIKQCPVSIVISDLNGRIEYVNPYFSQVSGYSPEDIIGTIPVIKTEYFQNPEDLKTLYNNVTNGKAWHGEMMSVKKNGEQYWESVSISALTDLDGKIKNFIAVKEHITEKKALASDLEKALAKSEESDRLKSSLMANLSHEFRTPMNGILGLATILQDLNQDVNQKKMLDGIYQSGKRLMNTLDAILEFANLEAETNITKPAKIDITEVAKNIIHGYRVKAMSKGLCFKAEICENPLFVLSNEKNIIQIFHQIIDNALKFTRAGFIQLKVLSATYNDKQYAKIEITDSGIGISAEHQLLIFEEFRQVSEGFSRSYEGSGLGLALVKKIINLLNGNIKVESMLGDGTTFTISIPVEDAAPTAMDAETDESKPIIIAPFAKTSKELNTLLVEDNQWNRDVIEQYLSGICTITHAEDGLSAIKSAIQEKFDLILMDINLGLGINGIETTKEIRKIDGYSDTPVVAITGYAMHKDKEYFLTEGLTHFLSKPFEKKDIVRLVAEINSELQAAAKN